MFICYICEEFGLKDGNGLDIEGFKIVKKGLDN
jgi:hypothetical protein